MTKETFSTEEFISSVDLHHTSELGYKTIVEVSQLNPMSGRKLEFSYRCKHDKSDMLSRWISRQYAASLTSLAAIEYAEQRLRITRLRFRHNVERGKQTPLYKQIEKICKLTGWPVHYKTDLDWDAHTIEEQQPNEILFAIRSSGTWTVTRKSNRIFARTITETDTGSRFFLVRRDGYSEFYRDEFRAYPEKNWWSDEG